MATEPLGLGWRAPRERNVPLLAVLLLAAGAAAEALEAPLHRAHESLPVAVLLAALLAGAVIAARGRGWFRLLTGLPFAVAAAGALLAATVAALAGARLGLALPRSGLRALLALLALAALAVAWKRRPYRPSRFGFLAVHLAPALLLAGLLWPGPVAARFLQRTAWMLLLSGMAWMFWLKPPLKRRERGGAP